MSTKIKGEAIKEDSISPYALEFIDFNQDPYVIEVNSSETVYVDPEMNTNYAYIKVEFPNLQFKDKYYYLPKGRKVVIFEEPVTFITYIGNNRLRIENDYGYTIKIYIYPYYEEPISDGLIPHSVARKYDVSTPDWNAQEGEAGYIENKPFDFVFNEDENYSNKWKNGRLIGFEFNTYEKIIVKVCTNTSDVFDYGHEPIYDILLLEGKYSEGGETYLLEKYNVRFSYFDSEWIISIIDTEDYNTVPIYISTRIEDLKQLQGAFIPNEIVKTTPQIFSTADKNQVKENLGLPNIIINDEILVNLPLESTEFDININPLKESLAFVVGNNITTINIAEEESETYMFDGSVTVYNNGYGEYTFIGESFPSGYPFSDFISDSLRKVQITYVDSNTIPDTVLKTTPQTLSDANKNQALANLGIDPVVYKYMCEPYVISMNGHVPEELKNIIQDEYGYLKNIASKLIVMEYDSRIYTITAMTFESITSEFATYIYNNGYFGHEP